MSDLTPFPIAFVGGLQDSKAEPKPSDLRKLTNFASMRGRFALRAPLFELDPVYDDVGNPVTSILGLALHDNSLFIVSWSTTTQKVYLHSATTEGGTVALEDVVWTSVTAAPHPVLTSFEGGSSTVGTKRLYIAEYDAQFDTMVWDGTNVINLTEDLNDDNTKENIRFHFVTSYQHHVWGFGFFEGTYLRPEMARFSRPGAIPEDEPNQTNNINREWWSVDFRPIGTRGDKITCVSFAGGEMLVFKKKETFALHGYDAYSWAMRPLSRRVGAVGPYAAATTGDGTCFFWSERGPQMCDGSKVTDISEPVRKHVLEAAISDEVVVEFSSDDGLIYFIYPVGGQTAPLHYLAFDKEKLAYVGEGEWSISQKTTYLQDAFTDPDGTNANAHNLDRPSAASWTGTSAGNGGYAISSNKMKAAGTAASTQAINTDTDVVNIEDGNRISAIITRPTVHGGSKYAALRFRANNVVTGAGSESFLLRVDWPASEVTTTVLDVKFVRQINAADQENSTLDAGTLSFPAGTSLEFSVVLDGGDMTAYYRAVGATTWVALGATWTPSTGWNDSSHRRVGLEIKSAGTSADNAAFFESLLSQTTPVIAVLQAFSAASIASSTLPGPIAAPGTPNLTVLSDNDIQVDWVNGDTALDTTTEIYRDTGSGATTLVGTVETGVTSFTDTGLTAKTTYYYRLRHLRNAQYSDYSAESSAKTALQEPQSFTTTRVANGVRLSYTNNEAGADIEVDRSPEGGGFTLIDTIATPGTGALTYDDTDAALVCGSRYTYRMRAVQAGEASSAYTSESTSAACSPPSISGCVTAIQYNACPSGTRITLTWSSTNPGATDLIRVTRVWTPNIGAVVSTELAQVIMNLGSYVDRYYVQQDNVAGETGALSYLLEVLDGSTAVSSCNPTAASGVTLRSCFE